MVERSPQVDVLAGFLNVSPQKLKLFNSNVSGWNALAFHSSCDHQGATLTLIRCGKYYTGGYASVSWNSNNQYLADPKAFLFRFQYDAHLKIVSAEEKFERNGTGNELYAGDKCGPIFGCKHDLYTFGGQSTQHTPLQDIATNGKASFSVASIFSNADARVSGSVTLEVLQVGTVDGLEELEQSWLSDFPWAPEMG